MMPRTEPKINISALCAEDAVADEVTILRLPVSRKIPAPERFPGKRYVLTDTEAVAKLSYSRAQWFSAETLLIGDLESLHAAFERARTSAGYVVAGSPAPGSDPRSLRRTKAPIAAVRDEAGKMVRRGAPAGLVDCAHHWVVLDLDGVPSGEIDPRRDPDIALNRIRSLLPLPVREAAVSWQWSASTCLRDAADRLLGDRIPERVGVHLRFWLDERQGEAGRRELLGGIAAYVAEQCSGAVVDPAVATFNQAIFCASSYESGLADPFPGDLRSGILPGMPVVSLSDLCRELPEPIRAPKKAATTSAERREKSARQSHDTLLCAARGQREMSARVVKLGFVRRDPLARAYEKGKQARIDRRKEIFRERALADILTLVEARRRIIREWSEGVPDGMRTRTTQAVAALLSWLVPVDRLEAEIREYALKIVAVDWYDRVFAPNRRAAFIIEAARAAKAAADAGREPDGRVDRCKKSLLNLLNPSVDEQLRLAAIRTKRIADAQRYAANPRPRSREQYWSAVRKGSISQARPWESLGMSRASWYRRNRGTNAPSTQAAAPRTGLSVYGLRLLSSILSVGALGSLDPEIAKVALDGLALGEAAENVGGITSLADALQMRMSNATPEARRNKATTLNRLMVSLEAASRAAEPVEFIVEELLKSEALAIRARDIKSRQPVILSVVEILDESAACSHVRQFVDRLGSLVTAGFYGGFLGGMPCERIFRDDVRAANEIRPHSGSLSRSPSADVPPPGISAAA